MKTKFFLTLLTFTGVLLVTNSAFAATGSSLNRNRSITNLSQTIANLIELEDRSLVEQAIDRALLVQQVNQPEITPLVTAGIPRADANPTAQKPNVRGRTDKNKPAQSKEPSIGQAKKIDNQSIGQAKKIDNQSIGQAKKIDNQSIGQAKKSDNQSTGRAKRSDNQSIGQTKKNQP